MLIKQTTKFILAFLFFVSILVFQNCAKIENSPVELSSLEVAVQSSQLTDEMQSRVDQILKVSEDANQDGFDDSLLLWQDNFATKYKASMLLSEGLSAALMIEFTGFSGTLLSLYANAPFNEEIRLEYREGSLVLTKFQNDKIYSQFEISESLMGIHFVGLRVGSEADDVEVVLDGKAMDITPKLNGQPGSFSLLSKTLVLSSRTISSFLFNRGISSLDLALLNKLQAAQIEMPLSLHSNLSYQFKRPATVDPNLPVDYFKDAAAILKNRCQSCHSWAGETEDKLISSGRVVKGSLEQSILYYRLTGSTVGVPKPGVKQNMPVGSSALSSSEMKALEYWILNLK